LKNTEHTFRVVVSADCNLRCSYCSTNCGRFDGGAGRMSDETIAATIGFIAETGGFAGDVRLIPSGGEPLMHLDAIEALVSGLRARLSDGRRLSVTLTTNGTLLDEACAARIRSLGCEPQFSIDGPAAVHDHHRVFADGRGSHAHAVRGLETWRRTSEAAGIRPRLRVQAAISRSDSLSAVMRYFDELDIDEVCAIPVKKSAWRSEADGGGTSPYAREFVNEAERYLNAHGPRELLEEPPRLYALGRLLTTQLFDVDANKHCGIGRTVLGIDRDGGLWPCDGFIGLDDSYRLGNVRLGLDEQRLESLEARLSVYQQGCAGCGIETRCNDLCLAQALLDGFEPGDDPTSWCEQLRWISGEIAAMTEKWRSK